QLSPGAVLSLLVAALLNCAQAGDYQGTTTPWQQTSAPPPNAVNVEPKLTKAFVVHVPIPSQYAVGGAGNDQTRPNGPTPAPLVPFRAAASQQESANPQQPGQLDQQQELKKLVILLRIPQERPFQSIDKTPQSPTPHDKLSYHLQVDKQLPIILIALDKPLPPHAKVHSQNHHQQQNHQQHNQHHHHHNHQWQQDVEEKGWKPVAPSLAWAASPQQQNWQYQDPLPYQQRSPSASQSHHYYVQRKDGFTDRFTVRH
ncbi:unnamed protein product, partial [Ixodes hexagonus]